MVNIYEALNFIRKSDEVGEFTEVSDAIMDLYLKRKITTRTVLVMYGGILHHMALISSPYCHTPKYKKEKKK